MTTPERSEEIDYQQLAKDLRIKSGMIAMGERITYGSDSGIMDAAADAIEQLTQTLQAERQKREEMIPKEKPMGVFSFVLRGKELDQYMRHKGWNECRDAVKEALTQPREQEEPAINR